VDSTLSVGGQLDSFRAARRDIEASVLPLATSVDGRRFTFQASLYGLRLQAGGYAVLDDGGGVPRLGQVLALEMDQQRGAELTLPPTTEGSPETRTEVRIRCARGEGVIIDGDQAPCHDALIRVATETEVQGWQQRAQSEATLWLGDLAMAAGVPALADARGFSRHTFLCGQSGSGKTYSLGVILERLLTETDLRIVVLDPNSTMEELNASDLPEARHLGLRLANLGVDRYTVWARGEEGSVLDAVHDDSVRCVVIDLGSLANRDEQSLVAAVVLGDLWHRRAERRPVLIVIDEAHNVCPAAPPDRLVALATEHAIRIAAEGRKFGLYLLVSTQRPQKIPENVLSQADNLVLLRLNSLADAAFAEAIFSFVPPSLIQRSSLFRQGEGLIAGKISPQPALLRFGARISEESGGDVPATWARPR